MRTILLPRDRQNCAYNSDKIQSERNFASYFVNRQHLTVIPARKTKWYYLYLVFLLLLIQGVANAQITYVGSLSASGSSISLPAGWAPGDLALVFAFRSGSNTAPSTAGGFSSINNDNYNPSGSSSDAAGALSYRVLQAGDGSFNFNNAGWVEIMVLRGTRVTSMISKDNTNSGGSTTLSYPSLTGTIISSSWVVGFGGHRTSTNVNAATAGSMTVRSNGVVNNLGMHSLTGVTSFGATNWSAVNQNAGWVTSVVEVLEYVQPYYFRSIGSGDWNAIATWEQSVDNSTWVNATRTPTSLDNTITIRSGNNVTVSASVDADECTIETGGTVTIASGQTWTIANGSGTDLTVDGTLVNSGTLTLTGTAAFNSGSTYEHAQNGGTIPTATWNSSSTCLISGITASTPGGLGQSFGNFTWDCPAQTGAISFAAALVTVNGNLTIINTNSGSTRLSNGGANTTFTLGGDYIQTGGSFYFGGTSSSNTWTINVNGNFSLSGGSLDMSGNSGSTTLNLHKNFTMSSGTLTESGTATCNVNFNGTPIQTFSKSGGTISNTINFTIPSPSIVDFGTSVLDGSNGTFNLNSGAGIITANVEGLQAAGSNLGSIQTTNRTYSSGADYTYNGSSAQVGGTGLTAGRNLTIDNSAGVSLSVNANFTALLTMSNGTLSLSSHDLTVGSLTGSGGITNNTPGSATLTVGSGNNSTSFAGPISNGPSGSMVTNLTKVGSGTLTLTNSVFTFTGATINSGGELRLNPSVTTASLESPIVLNAGNLSTVNIATGTTITSSSTLELIANSAINLGSNDHTIIFAPSGGVPWTGNALTINGWTGTAGSSGSGGKIFFGSASGLTNAQLLKITFTGYAGGATILPSGELVPAAITSPILSITGTTDNGISCDNTAAAPITYTIHNIGTTAHDVYVASSDPQFVVSNLSSTTIPGTNGTATFQVTFTPAGGGAKSAIITVTTSDAGSNSPTISLTGSGVAQPTATAGGSQRICQNGTATVSGATAANGSIQWSEDGAGSITSGATTLTPIYTAAAGDAGNTVTLTMTVSSTPCLPATATYLVHVDAFATANAGADQSACPGGTITMAGSIGGSATSSTWSAPSGTFDDASSLNSTYTPSIPSGSVVLTLTANDPLSPCPDAVSTMTVTVNPPPTVTPVSICQGTSGTLIASCATSSGGTSGPNDAGNGTNVSIGTNASWSNPGYIVNTSDANYASVSTNNGTPSDYLQGTGYNFGIPSNAEIQGIQVIINRLGGQGGSSGFYDVNVYLVKNNSIQISGDNKANLGTRWPTSLGTQSYGGSSDLWGNSWIASDINNANFGVALSNRNSSNTTRTASVDYMRITVTYTIPESLNWYTQSSGGSIVQTGSPFNPIGDAEVIAAGAPYDKLNNSNTPGTYTFYAECSTNPGCRSAVNFVINPAPAIPTITPVGPVDLCTTSGLPVVLQSSAATGNQWYRNAVLLAGENNQILNVNQPGDYTVTATNGTCTSLPSVATSVVSITPEITIDAAASSTCFNGSGTELSTLNYSAVLNSPSTYSIVWNASPIKYFCGCDRCRLAGKPNCYYRSGQYGTKYLYGKPYSQKTRWLLKHCISIYINGLREPGSHFQLWSCFLLYK